MSKNNSREARMRRASNPWPKTEAALIRYVRSMVKRQHDYGTAVYATSLSAVATFNYLASELGLTGFQASCADLDFFRRTRGIEGPMIFFDGDKLLYPQYNVQLELHNWRQRNLTWAAKQARKLLKKNGTAAHPDVIAHWKQLAAYKAPRKYD